MKEQNRNINREVQRTMASLDRHKRLEGNPYMYTRIKARIEAEDASKNTNSFIASWIQPAMFLLLLLVNVYTVYPLLTENNSDEAYLEVIVEEYDLGVAELTNFYNFD